MTGLGERSSGGGGKHELNRGVLLCETRRAVRSTLEGCAQHLGVPAAKLPPWLDMGLPLPFDSFAIAAP